MVRAAASVCWTPWLDGEFPEGWYFLGFLFLMFKLCYSFLLLSLPLTSKVLQEQPTPKEYMRIALNMPSLPQLK